MSVLHECGDCGTAWETAWGENAGECPQCERVQERLASGGLGLTARERAATAAFLGLVVPDEGAAYEVEGHEGAMTWGHGGFTYTLQVRREVATDGGVVQDGGEAEAEAQEGDERTVTGGYVRTQQRDHGGSVTLEAAKAITEQ